MLIGTIFSKNSKDDVAKFSCDSANSRIGGDRSLSKAFNDYPLAAMLHIADMKATYLSKASAEIEQTSFS